MKIKALINGEYIEKECEIAEQETVSVINSDEALNEFITALASPETNSIAKIRAAAQKFIDNTQGI